ncbi:hypothetical protein AB0N17_42605 [Streptomyces sp. NPDC051133]|uniref:hypothetical protein n=1 Tax=Streptomyces sp. NPDC051133 TaxID=3155521 RepID=UPI00341B3EC0
MIIGTTAHADSKLTDLDRIILMQSGRSFGARDQNGKAVNFANDWASGYCAKVGLGDGENQCHLNYFNEESFSGWTPHYKKRISDLLFNCSKSPATQNLSWSYTKEASVTAGYSVSVAVAAGGDFAPLGVGGTLTVTVTGTQSTSWSWGSSSTQSSSDTLTVQPGEVGWFDRGDFYGTAHGIADVTISKVDFSKMPPGTGLAPGEYSIVTDITGVMPKQSDPAVVAAQGAVGMISDSRPMTPSELASCDDKSSYTAKG